MVVKERLDALLVQLGLFPLLHQAQTAIMAGLVEVAGKVVDKSGTRVDRNAKITVKEAGPRYVSRGAVKLQRALSEFGIKIKGKVFIDIGASTGGFTEYLLREGARRVIAVDVGYGQLAWSLRQDPRVQVLERQNIRYLKPEKLIESPDAATIDVSFISLLKVIPNLLSLLKPDEEIIALVKPQFEIGKGKVEKGGLVRKKEGHQEVLVNLWRRLEELGLRVKGITFSPLKGDKGNIEFFLYLTSKGRRVSPKRVEERVRQVVDEAHAVLG
jgi:23S rRNA (cytidine1920-2'-O)/16S rRNA (cytidine1409-2'-O)-methyltransferase